MSIQSRSTRLRRASLSAALATGIGLCVVGYAAPGVSTPGSGSPPDAAAAAPALHGDGAAGSDAGITAQVRAKLAQDDRLRQSHIKVTTSRGVVTLRGAASSSAAKKAAEELARGVVGVKSVNDKLASGASKGALHKTVAVAERVGSDSWITTQVKSDILAKSVNRGIEVHVRTVNGVVHLRGTLSDADAIARIRDMTGRIQGVKGVDTSQLKSRSG